jgi:hypothetical protein
MEQQVQAGLLLDVVVSVSVFKLIVSIEAGYTVPKERIAYAKVSIQQGAPNIHDLMEIFFSNLSPEPQ